MAVALQSTMGVGGAAGAPTFASLLTALGFTYYYPMAVSAVEVISGADGTFVGGTATYGLPITPYITGVAYGSATDTITSQAEFCPNSDYTTVWWVKYSSASRIVWMLQNSQNGNQIQPNSSNGSFCASTRAFYRRFAGGTEFQCSINPLGDGLAHMLSVSAHQAAGTCEWYVDGVSQGAPYTVALLGGHGANPLSLGFATLAWVSPDLAGAFAQLNGTALAAASHLALYNRGFSGT